MDCFYACLYCCDQFLERYIRGRKTVQIVLGVIGGSLLMLILLAIFGAFRSAPCPPPPPTYAVLSKSWPPNRCMLGAKFAGVLSKHCKANEQLPKQWTIQGLWIRLQDRQTTLAYCHSRADQFDPKQLSGELRGKLDSQWPSLYEGQTNEDHWRHEWNAQGSCSSNSQTPLDYFAQTVALNEGKKFDLSALLAAKSIKASNTAPVKLADVQEAIKAEHGEAQFAVHCEKTSTKTTDSKEHLLLKDVVFCVANDVHLTNGLRDCTADLLKVEKTTCSEDFYLLEDSSKSWGPTIPTTLTTEATPTTAPKKPVEDIPIPDTNAPVSVIFN